MVLLETDPGIRPVAAPGTGTVNLVESSTDHLVVEAVTPTPAVLLITDAYSRGWRAAALDGSDRDTYTLMPADHCLQAVPLTAGRHRIRIEYAPKGYRVGKWVSIASLVAYAATWAVWLYRRRRRTGTCGSAAAPSS